MIEQQAVLAAPGDDVQAEPDLPQEGLRLLQAPQLGRRQEAMGGEPIEGVAAEVALGDPGDGLDVAQATGACLDIGLEVVSRVVGFQVAVGLLAHLGFEEFPHRPDALRGESSPHLRDQIRVAFEQPRFEQRRHDAHVRDALLGAFLDGAHAVADFKADVPEESDEALDRTASPIIGGALNQQQDVDVGAGVQLPAPVAADGDQRPIAQGAQRLRPPCFLQNRVDQRGARVDQILDGLLREKAVLELLVRLPQQVPIGRGRVAGLGKQRGQPIEQRPQGRRGGRQSFLDELRVSRCHVIAVVRSRPM